MRLHTVLLALQAGGAFGPPATGAVARADFSPGVRCDSVVAARAPSADAAAGVFASVRLHGATTRWADRSGTPLRLWVQRRVDRPRAARRTPAEWHDAVVEAARAWNRVPSAPPFRVVRDSSAADVRVVWTRVLAPAHGSPLGDVLAPVAAGRTAIRRAPHGGIADALVTLASETSTGVPYSRRDVTAVALHELGHALGLAHRADSASVMSPVIVAESVAPVDAATVHALYALPVGLRCDARVTADASRPGRPSLTAGHDTAGLIPRD